MQPKHRDKGDRPAKPAKQPAADQAQTVPDDVQIASADSFPASDPPGWIDTEAHPVPPAPKKPTD